jgi:hypothetical protein
MLTISSVAVAPMPQQAPAVRPQQPVTSVKPSNAVSPSSLGVPAAAAQAGQGLGVQALYAPSALPPVAPTSEVAKVEPEKNAAAPEKVGLAQATTVGLARSPVAEAALAVAATRANGNAGGTSSAGSTTAAASANGNANTTSATGNENPVNATAQQEQARRTQDAQAEQGAQQANARAEQRRAQADRAPVVEVKNPAMEAMDTQIKELLPNMWKASRAAVDVLIGEEAMAAAAARAEVLGGGPTERALEATETYVQTSAGAPASTTGAAVDRLV